MYSTGLLAMRATGLSRMISCGKTNLLVLEFVRRRRTIYMVRCQNRGRMIEDESDWKRVLYVFAALLLIAAILFVSNGVIGRMYEKDFMRKEKVLRGQGQWNLII